MPIGQLVDDPDDYALLVVQQYLFEKSYTAALSALERAAGLKFVESKLQTGSQLMQMVYHKMEEDLADSYDESELQKQAAEERLLQGGASDFPSSETSCIEGIFSTNVISVLCWPHEPQAFVGTGDGFLQLVSLTGQVLWKASPAGSGGILSLSLKSDRTPALILAGYMDGTAAVYSAEQGHLLSHGRLHRKYCVRVRWAPSSTSRRFVTASWDNTLAVHEIRGEALDAPVGPANETMTMHTLWAPVYTAAVQDVEYINKGKTLVAAIRGSNYLRLLDMESLQEEGKTNMNALGDDHVSFTASHLSASPCGSYLLVSTDGPRIIMFKIQGWEQIRNFYDLQSEQFHVPCALWHGSGFYIMAAAAAGYIYIFHVGTAKVVATFKAHTKNARALDYDPHHNVLVTGSFDRTVKVFAHQPCSPPDDDAS